LRLVEPRPEAIIISGVKRDIKLLKQVVGVTGAVITVLDISLDSNREYLPALLATCRIMYIDHHFAGSIPDSGNLETHIDADPEVCTSLLVDRLLGGRFRPWAVVAAFGDNLHRTAAAVAPTDWSTAQLDQARELGELLNYNSYGAALEDLHFTPQALYAAIRPYEDPFEFFRKSPVLSRLRDGFAGDMQAAAGLAPYRECRAGRVFMLPGEPWARRVAGVFINEKARDMPESAHVLLTENSDKSYMISVRAPLADKRGADILCRQFPTGGGRAAAAGINSLPPALLPEFLRAFEEVFAQ
ncbi:MAG: acetyltransferase, partial [Deltaproteobacteria bacterium RIFOXYD12_FULL_50_9]